ncbi:MAG: DNA polymerase III subunit alpha [Treponema porcinum]|uniref:DNA polymerase III subunit alpha n=1 Tax=Treponema porcinum TaxID=261392 RepID=UPI002A7ECAC9|nr:DNA polymerase III subunit alpha [Treponema porcinum]MDY5121511.1 DNA polymerase III subunit alpha [Treponema porcinum]
MADIPHFDDPPEGTPVSQFVHLHVHSDYSLLDSTAKLSSLVKRAKELNMPALALTDHGNMFGVLNFEHICHANGINPIVGCEFYVTETDHKVQERTKYGGKYYHLILLCENETGYKNMSWLCSNAYTEGLHYGKPNIDFEMLKERHEGLICLSACIQGQIPQALLNDDDEWAEEVARKYSELFGPDHYYIELQDHGLPDQKIAAEKLINLAEKLNLPLVVTNDIHYCNKDDAEAQDALRCIGFKRLLDEPHQTMGDGRTEWYFKTEEEMRRLFPNHPEAYENTIKIANMCNLIIHQYTTPELKGCLPRFELPKEFQRHKDYSQNQDDFVRHLVEKGLRQRYKEITPEIRERAEYELAIIFKMGFSGYFLIVWEFINWSKEHGIPIGPGRGSGAGSLVAYCMTITDIDPFRFNLIFERFLNPERVSMPDFDIDMDFDYRQTIIQHTRELYGDPQVGHIVTFGTLKPKQCIADVGRVLGIPLSEVNMLKACIPDSPKAKLKDAFSEANEKFPDGGKLIPYKDDPRYKRLFELAFKLEGVNRNTGLHASGMVIGLTALPDWAPVFKDPKTGEVAVQYTMDIIEPCGLVKFDYLGLKTLSLIRYAEDIINKHKKPDEPVFKTENVSETDSETFDMFGRGDSVAVFQFESPGMQKILRQVQPRCIEELVALNALYRPGPMDYIPQYIDGKWKPETVHYPDPCLEGLLKETYGVMVYQEQVMQVSQKIAGFSLGGADMLRRAMGKKKPEVLMGKKKEFIEGAIKNGFTEQHAADIFEIMIPFAGYGFNKSHAAAYTVLAYRTGWLKCHFPAEFMAANLTNELTSTDGVPFYIAEARRMGIPVDPPDINKSDVRFDVVDGHIVFALMGLKGMGEEAAKAIVQERTEHGDYKSFMDFLERVVPLQVVSKNDEGKELKRSVINSKAIEVCIRTGAFDKLGQNRPTLLNDMDRAVRYVQDKISGSTNGQGDLFGDTDEKVYADFVFNQLDDLPTMEKLNDEMEVIGCYVSGHPLDDYKKVIQNCVTLTSNNIERAAKESQAEKAALAASGQSSWQMRNTGKTYTVLGFVHGLHPFRTKKGTDMAFAKLSDYNGEMDLTFFSKTWETLKTQVQDGKIAAFKGKVDGSREQPSFIVDSIEDPSVLKERSIKEVHIEIENSFQSEAEVSKIKDFLFAQNGNCSLYFHIDTASGPFIVKANSQLTVSSSKEVLSQIEDLPLVKDVWCE